MTNPYLGGTPIRGAAAGVDDVRLNLSGVGTGVYSGRQQQQSQPPSNQGVYYSSGMIQPQIGRVDNDNRSIASTPSKISKFTYSEYPQIRPTNPLYTSTATIKTGTSAVSRGTTLNTVSRRQKYNPNQPRRIKDWRWASALATLLFFPTGLIALGLAIKAQTKFGDGFIDEAKKLNKRAFAILVFSFICAFVWLLVAFFFMDKWPRTYG